MPVYDKLLGEKYNVEHFAVKKYVLFKGELSMGNYLDSVTLTGCSDICCWSTKSYQELRSDRLEASEDSMVVVPWKSLLGWLSVSISPAEERGPDSQESISKHWLV